MIRLVNRARVFGLTPYALFALLVAERAYAKFGFDCEVTCGPNGTHMRGSKHYVGNAFDLRTKHIPEQILPSIVKELTEALGEDYDVLLEATHLHVEFDPKEAMNA